MHLYESSYKKYQIKFTSILTSIITCTVSKIKPDQTDFFFSVRSLPDLQYLGTIRDIESNSGAVMSFAAQEIDDQLCFVSGGSHLRVWNQVSRRGRKRKG